MLVSDLIKELQNIEINHDRTRYHEGEDMLGPANIVIDAWDDGKYLGITGDIVLTLDPSTSDWLIRWPGW